ncbi:hypothetical protein TWF730_006673 [Orbilia blumenaviensis]|uniref:Uncharacterized protein n=1 Tax=Orbilia blumenaviensis TaxID=1796055 RepID=A0AAV9VIE9_9PEZI
MLFKFSPAVAFAVLATISELDRVSAHVRFVEAFGDYSLVRGIKLGHWEALAVKNHGAHQDPGQYDVTVFSDPAVPACCKSPWVKRKRFWLEQGCGTSLKNIFDFYARTGQRSGNAEISPAAYMHKNKISHLRQHRNWHFFMGIIPPGAFVQTNAETLAFANRRQIAQATPGGWIQITTFQVNADGAGPFRCRLDESGTGQRFGLSDDPNKGGWLIIDQQPGPGAGKEKWKSVWPSGNNKRHTLRVRIPGDVKCKAQFGNVKNVCQLRCENFATNGPFGGCVPFQVIYPEPEVVPPPEAKTVTVTIGKPEPTSGTGDAGIDVGDDTYQEDGY